MRFRAPRRAAAVVGGAVVTVGCGLGVGGLGAPGLDAGGYDASMPADEAMAPVEAAPEAEAAIVDASPQDPATTIETSGVSAGATGLAQQAHVFYATESARWWLLWVDDTDPLELQAASSPDFVTWTTATPLSLPATLQEVGGDFSAAYASIAGVDVVHVTLGLHFAAQDRRHYHVRATVSGAAILWGMPQPLAAVTDPKLVDPDGPATVITPDGHIWDSTGWAQYLGTGNEVAWESTGTDLGTSWDGNFGLQQGIAMAANTINARALFTVGTGASPVALWEVADQEPNPTNVAWSESGGFGWGMQADVFPAGKTQGADDWDAVLVSATDLRAVRRALDSSYDHASFDGTSWTAMTPPTSDPGLVETGVVTLSDGPRVAVVAIGSDAAQSVRMTEWDGVSWAAWKTLDGVPAGRSALSGWSTTGHAAVVWTQAVPGSTDGGSAVIAGMVVQL